MTVEELHERAIGRNRIISGKLTVAGLRGWLDCRVEDGWLVKRGGRYFLTTEGFWIAQALGGAHLDDMPVAA